MAGIDALFYYLALLQLIDTYFIHTLDLARGVGQRSAAYTLCVEVLDLVEAVIQYVDWLQLLERRLLHGLPQSFNLRHSLDEAPHVLAVAHPFVGVVLLLEVGHELYPGTRLIPRREAAGDDKPVPQLTHGGGEHR